MLACLDDYDATPGARSRLQAQFDRALEALRANRKKLDRGQVVRAETAVAAEPQSAFGSEPGGSFRLNDWGAGRFACPSLGELARACPNGAGRVRLWILSGTSAITDIGALQAAALPGSLFQVASQFNCLESPGPYLVAVSKYFEDPTQGPRASISAFPATLLRHYAAPDGRGGRFCQTATRQLNLLEAVAIEPVAKVESGYLRPAQIADPVTFASLLSDHFEDLKVGLHEDLEVVRGANWDGPVDPGVRIDQVFTSTLAAGGYGRYDRDDATWNHIVRQLQRAAYLGTLLAAAGRKRRRAVLTLIGGGVFGNPHELILESLLWACDQVQAHLAGDLTVIVNGRELAEAVPASRLEQSARERGGELVLCTEQGARVSRKG